MSAAQRERTENVLNDLFAYWKNNTLSTPLKFLNMEKQRDACMEIFKTDQGQCLKLYSIGVEYLMKMVEAGRTGNGGEIYKAGNESYAEMAALTEKYCRDRSAAVQKLWQSFVPWRESSETGA